MSTCRQGHFIKDGKSSLERAYFWRCQECKKEKMLIIFFACILFVPPISFLIIFDISERYNMIIAFAWWFLLWILYYNRAQILYSKEVKLGLTILDDMDIEFKNPEFRFVKNLVKENISTSRKNRKYFSKRIKGGTSQQELLLTGIVNFTGDLIESGNNHIYRGVLDPTGDNLLKIHNIALAKLVELKITTKADAECIQQELLERIKDMG